MAVVDPGTIVVGVDDTEVVEADDEGVAMAELVVPAKQQRNKNRLAFLYRMIIRLHPNHEVAISACALL